MYLIWKVLITFSLTSFVIAQTNLISPCPQLFQYETSNKQPDRWFGKLTMISDTNTHGNFVIIYLDRPALQLGNWYGMVDTKDNKKYIIYDVADNLKARTKKVIRFFIKYNTAQPPPKLIAYSHNSKNVCPEVHIPETTTKAVPPKPLGIEASLNKQFGDTNEQEGEDFFMGDLYNLFNPSSQTDIEKSSTTDDICGTVMIPPKPLITYGQQTVEGEFPWHVALYHSKGVSWIYVCGASLISKDFVITAGHCVTRPGSKRRLKSEDLNAYLGKHYLKSFSDKAIQDRAISEIIVHPQYSGHNFSNDIALLKLARPAEYTDYVRPICLWQDSIDLESIVDKYGKVVGWGFDETGMVTPELMQTEMPVVSVATCLYSFRQFFARFLSKDNFCAGLRNGSSVCNGDSGGGLVFPKSNSSPGNPIWQLRGLVSISAATQNHFKCDASHFIIYTDVAKYLDWIRNKIN